MKQMSNLSIVMLLVLPVLIAGSINALAATANPPPSSPGYQTMVLPILGTYSSPTITPVTFKAPFRYQVLSASATARAVSGTNPTLTVDVKTGSTSVFTTPLVVSAGAIADAVLSPTPKFNDEAPVSVVLSAGGTAPKWRDITLLLVLKRL